MAQLVNTLFLASACLVALLLAYIGNNVFFTLSLRSISVAKKVIISVSVRFGCINRKQSQTMAHFLVRSTFFIFIYWKNYYENHFIDHFFAAAPCALFLSKGVCKCMTSVQIAKVAACLRLFTTQYRVYGQGERNRNETFLSFLQLTSEIKNVPSTHIWTPTVLITFRAKKKYLW